MHNPAIAAKSASTCRFGRFELRPIEYLLFADREPVTLGARAFDLLVVLVDRAGELVTKNDLLTLVWPGLVVEENNLQVQVSTLRKVLGPNAIATIPGRGYRFDLPTIRTETTSPPTAPDGAACVASQSTAAALLKARTNLPARLPQIYGRSEDLVAVKALLREHALVTIVGAGGIGKTCVAQAVAAVLATARAADYPDGVWWVELAALSDAAYVPSAVAHVLNVQLSGNRDAAEIIVSLLASQQLLLLIDNCEHLTDAVAAFIKAVCAGAPLVTVLVPVRKPSKSPRSMCIASVHSPYRTLGARPMPRDPGRWTCSSRARRPSIHDSY